ncbi:phage baseplate assembly protein V [Empedobacter tilapiae]|uniref:type VI secretion system Vgr family protein n=1 Tax=Empedobacter tilapiae TaxID=2491114 RepID=UPI0028D2AE87|nr:phage baseplate assembly protein V [Empedobacter tilapiae]
MFQNDKPSKTDTKKSESKLLQANSKQDYSKMFLNNPIIPNSKTYVDRDLWANQPTSKIYNAKKIPDHDIVGINRIVKLSLIIDGQIINFFKHFKLIQSAKKHHEFTLELAHDVLGKSENYRLENAQSFLGKKLTVIFRYSDVEDSPERVFVGVITEVGFVQEQGSLGNILLTGYSPTILLDAAPHTQSFGGTDSISLNSIADQVIKQGISKSKFDYRVASRYGNISYSAQYEETHYNYLARMAEAYGEQFFYDGEVLHFGELPPPQQPITLTYGSNVNDIKINMRALHTNPSFYGYNSSKNEKLTTGDSQIKHTSDIAKRAYFISEQTFKTPSLRVAPIKAKNFTDITTSQKGTAGSKAVDVFVTSGTTTIPFLYPGCIADIEMRKTDSNKTSYFTKLMITETSHEVDARGYYKGTFEAIAANTGFLPRPKFRMPRAEIQVAKVTSNSDPKNQGRVQIQFDWQKGYEKSEFIRVMTPDAGASDKVSTNRGFMAIPEVGDQVMVGFQHHHPDRPFVLGGMFHGKVGAGGGQMNNIKSLSSRSGNKLELNDGEGSVFLTDKGGANMKFDGGGNATTNANTNHTVNAGANNTINAGSTNVINVGGKEGSGVNSMLSMDAGGNITLECDTNITIKTGESSITLTMGGDITIEGLNVKVIGKTTTEVGKANANPGIKVDADININATKINSSSSGPTNIKGADVEINKG